MSNVRRRRYGRLTPAIQAGFVASLMAATSWASGPAFAGPVEVGPVEVDAVEVDAVGAAAVRSYVIPQAGVAGVSVTPLMTVGDPAGGSYGLVGKPDGLGAFTSSAGRVEVLVAHELSPREGISRAHGRDGAFVALHTIDPATKQVVGGRDLITKVSYWDYATGDYSPNAGLIPGTTFDFGATLKRFCSATLVGPAELFNGGTGRGYDGRLFLTGEEGGENGRLFATDVSTGEARQLPRAGLHSWENAAVLRTGNDVTALVGTTDGTPGFVTGYFGTKTAAGGPWNRAGLTNGTLGALRLAKRDGATITTDFEFRQVVGKGLTVRAEWTDVEWNQRGVAQSEQATQAGALAFSRIEDVAIDPRSPRDVYFVTTFRPTAASMKVGDAYGGLWRLRLDDAANPAAGGTLTLLLDGNEPGRIFAPDNLTVDNEGHILIQEDPGNDPYLAGIYAYRISDGATRRIATFDPAVFSAPAMQNEESSGIIDSSGEFGPGTFLFDVQAHNTAGLPPGTGPGTIQELVENGQLSILRVDWPQIFPADAHRFVAVTPARVFDSRIAVPKPAAGSTTTVTVAGQGGVPANGAAAVVLNITATQVTAPGYFSVFPAGSPVPATSSLNADRTGETISNQVTVALGAGGAISLYAEQGAHLIVDVAGYYLPAASARAGRLGLVTPTRALDTRVAGAKPAAGSVTELRVTGRGGVPANGVSAVVVNLTATQTDAEGYFTVYPAYAPRPNASNLNVNGPRESAAALVTVPVGLAGAIKVYAEQGAHLIVDVVGWYTDATAPDTAAGLFVPRPLTRVLDTRVASRLAAGSTTVLDLGLPTNSSAVVTNLTVTAPAGPGYLTTYAAGGAVPPTSNINVSTKNETLANAAIVQLGEGRVAVFSEITTHFVVDIAGYIT